MKKEEIPNAISQVIDEVNRISALTDNDKIFTELTELRAENERLKAEREWILEFGNHLQAHIKVTPEGIEVIRAVNGWGDSVPLSEVKIFPSPPKQ
jgi:hypothetical protein